MSKRISIISIFICTLAVVAGMLSAPVQSAIYEWNNGPPLVKPGFGERIRTANIQDDQFYKKYNITAAAIDENPGSSKRRGFTIHNKINSKLGCLLMVQEYSDNKFLLQAPLYDVKKSGWYFKSKGKEYGAISLNALSRIIDSEVFPDTKTRKQNKLKLLNRIDELNSI